MIAPPAGTTTLNQTSPPEYNAQPGAGWPEEAVADALVYCVKEHEEPTVRDIALEHSSLDGGGGGVQEVHCTVVVRQELAEPQAAVFQCANKVPVKVFATVNGDGPKATTGPPEVPLRTVIIPLGVVDVNTNVWPATAPDKAENSPSKLHVLMVTRVPAVLIAKVVDGNWVVLVH
jgi:hypothetical protein